MTEENKVTSVSDYRSFLSKPFEVKLPSGNIFNVRRLTPVDYINEGLSDIPNEFFSFIRELALGQMGQEKLESEEAKKNYEIFESFLKVTIEKGVVEPPMTLHFKEEKKDSHLIFSELTIRDQKFLVDAITGRLKVA